MLTLNNATIEKYNQIRLTGVTAIKNNTAYVKGKNPATLNAPTQKKPDNRITIPLGKIAVDTVHGYAGRAGDMQMEYEPVDIKKEIDSVYLDIQNQIAEHNNEPLETSSLYHTGLIQGRAYELVWVSNDLNLLGILTPEYKKVPNAEVLIVWSRDLKPRKEAALRFQSFEDMDVLDVYYPYRSESWIKRTRSSEWIRNKEADTVYPISKVPMIEYKINEDMESLFEAEKGLIDANDKILNKTVNEIDRFNALIALMPGKISKEVQDKLIQMGVIDDLQKFERWPEYMQKDLSGINDLYSGAAKWIKELFFQSASIPDFSDKEFLNAASGIAMAYKLVGLEFLASKIDTYFLEGIYERHEIINDILRESSKYHPDDYKLIIITNRNMPVDKAAAAEIVLKLNGILSKETLIKMLPKDIVQDAEVELQRERDEQDNVNLDAIPPLTVNE